MEARYGDASLRSGPETFDLIPLCLRFVRSCLIYRRALQVVEETLVHPERQLFILLWVHHRQGAERNYPARKHSGNFSSGGGGSARLVAVKLTSLLYISCRLQVREVPDRNKPNCFELYATGGNDFIKGRWLTPKRMHWNAQWINFCFLSFVSIRMCSLQDGFRGKSSGGQAHRLPNVRRWTSRKRRMDCLH